MSSADFTIYTPDIGTLSYAVSFLWGDFSAVSTANAIHNFSSICSIRHPLLPGGQRWHGMRGFDERSTHDELTSVI